MPIKFACPHCGKRIAVPDHLAAITGNCPRCGGTVQAPSMGTTAPPAIDPEATQFVPSMGSRHPHADLNSPRPARPGSLSRIGRAQPRSRRGWKPLVISAVILGLAVVAVARLRESSERWPPREVWIQPADVVAASQLFKQAKTMEQRTVLLRFVRAVEEALGARFRIESSLAGYKKGYALREDVSGAFAYYDQCVETMQYWEGRWCEVAGAGAGMDEQEEVDRIGRGMDAERERK